MGAVKGEKLGWFSGPMTDKGPSHPSRKPFKSLLIIWLKTSYWNTHSYFRNIYIIDFDAPHGAAQLSVRGSCTVREYREAAAMYRRTKLKEFWRFCKGQFVGVAFKMQNIHAIYGLQLQSISEEVCVAFRNFCTLPVLFLEPRSKLKLVK